VTRITTKSRRPSLAAGDYVRWFVIGCAVGLFVLWSQALAVGGWTGLLHVSHDSPLRSFIASEIPDLVILDVQNDGQISYAVASDPWGESLPDKVPQAPLRWRRFLFPALAGMLGIIDGLPLFWSMVGWLTLSFGVATMALRSILDKLGASVWGMIGLLAHPGVWMGLRIMTPDPMGMALALTGTALVLRRRDGIGLLALSLAVIAKEPYLLFAAALGAWRFFGGERKRGLLLFLMPTTTLALWTVVMAAVVPGSYFESPNSALPFLGIIEASGSWPSIEPRQNLYTGLTALILVAGVVVALRVRNNFVRWHLAAWVSQALITSEAVWRYGNANLRAFAPIGIFIGVALALPPGAGQDLPKTPPTGSGRQAVGPGDPTEERA